MPTTEAVKPQTAVDVIKAALKEDPDMRMFVLYRAGLGSEIAAAARSYPEMWLNAERELGETKKDLIKRGYVFDVMTAEDAVILLPDK